MFNSTHYMQLIGCCGIFIWGPISGRTSGQQTVQQEKCKNSNIFVSFSNPYILILLNLATISSALCEDAQHFCYEQGCSVQTNGVYYHGSRHRSV